MSADENNTRFNGTDEIITPAPTTIMRTNNAAMSRLSIRIFSSSRPMRIIANQFENLRLCNQSILIELTLRHVPLHSILILKFYEN